MQTTQKINLYIKIIIILNSSILSSLPPHIAARIKRIETNFHTQIIWRRKRHREWERKTLSECEKIGRRFVNGTCCRIPATNYYYHHCFCGKYWIWLKKVVRITIWSLDKKLFWINSCFFFNYDWKTII